MKEVKIKMTIAHTYKTLTTEFHLQTIYGRYREPLLYALASTLTQLHGQDDGELVNSEVRRE